MTTKTIAIQKDSSHGVSNPLIEDQPVSEAPLPGSSAMTTSAVVAEMKFSRDARAPDTIQLVQRIETLEAITIRLEQRLAALEQRNLLLQSHPIQAASINPCLQRPEIPQAAPLSIPTAPLPSLESHRAAQRVSVTNAASSSPPVVTLSPEDWTRGMVTNQLVKRLKTNPTTLKKYLRDLKQMQWAVQRDPDGLGWVYDSSLQCYYPVQIKSNENASTATLPASTADVNKPSEQCSCIEHQDELGSMATQPWIGTGGLYQSELSRLTGIPIPTLQRWKELPDCAERIRRRTEGRYLYGYSKQNKRFYPCTPARILECGQASEALLSAEST